MTVMFHITDLYTYSRRYLAPLYTASVAGIAGLFSIGYYFLGDIPGHAHVGSWSDFPLHVKAILFLTLMMPLSLFFITFIRARPIALDDVGITSFLFGKSWKNVTWAEITKIEQRRYYDAFFNRNRSLCIISGTKCRISFDDGINNLSSLLMRINRHVSRLGIPVKFIDRGRGAAAIDSAPQTGLREL